ncbi:menaquinone biosynthetic enzyme MqnA/MqnD family protein [Sporomusa malonica]|uniref:Chorismate dehydratase n=1 Tax=Sporomusa malonica TaxID=112901 RepID=A0A1W2E653_9FIRM|nr:menaquinone biosynthesis protein [Sporomusa malonica]SMD05145.1 futalosine synthase [Sporomusa malonica]
MRPRVGHIGFINCLPLYYGLVKNGVLWDVELTKDTARELSRHLLECRLDIAPVPSIEYSRHWRELILLPNLSISCDGPVTSIFLVSKVPINDLHDRKIALTNTSRTSQVLLKIILEDKYHIAPTYFECPPNLDAMLLEADAALLIGDAALNIHYQPPTGLYAYDLGSEWKDLTGCKMVFAVWAARQSFARENPELVREVQHAFEASMSYSMSRIEQVAKAAARWEAFDADFLQAYFTTLQFGFDAEHQKGLKEYYRRAQALGHIDEVPQLTFLEV